MKNLISLFFILLLVFSCGNNTFEEDSPKLQVSSIVGGERDVKNKYGSVGLIQNQLTDSTCTVNLTSETEVYSAAHCLISIDTFDKHSNQFNEQEHAYLAIGMFEKLFPEKINGVGFFEMEANFSIISAAMKNNKKELYEMQKNYSNQVRQRLRDIKKIRLTNNEVVKLEKYVKKFMFYMSHVNHELSWLEEKGSLTDLNKVIKRRIGSIEIDDSYMNRFFSILYRESSFLRMRHHAALDKNYQYRDIVKITLNRPVKSITPVPLMDREEFDSMQMNLPITIVGYGRDFYVTRASDLLRFVKVLQDGRRLLEDKNSSHYVKLTFDEERKKLTLEGDVSPKDRPMKEIEADYDLAMKLTLDEIKLERKKHLEAKTIKKFLHKRISWVDKLNFVSVDAQGAGIQPGDSGGPVFTTCYSKDKPYLCQIAVASKFDSNVKDIMTNEEKYVLRSILTPVYRLNEL